MSGDFRGDETNIRLAGTANEYFGVRRWSWKLGRLLQLAMGRSGSGEAFQGEGPLRIKVWKPGDSWDSLRVDQGEQQAIWRAELAWWSLSARSASVLATGIDQHESS